MMRRIWSRRQSPPGRRTASTSRECSTSRSLGRARKCMYFTPRPSKGLGWHRARARSWRVNAAAQIGRVTRALLERPSEEAPNLWTKTTSTATSATKTLAVNTNEAAILRALRSGVHEREDVLNSARVNLNRSRMGQQIRRSLEAAILSLGAKGLLVIEGAELFASDDGRTALLSTYQPSVSSGRKRRSYGYRRRW